MDRRPRARRSVFGVVAVGVLLGLIPLSVSTADAKGSSIDEKQRQRQQLRQQKAALASQIDALRADNSQIQKALDDLNVNVQADQVLLNSAQQALDQATQDVNLAQQRIAQTANTITQMHQQLAGFAIDSYVHPFDESWEAVLSTSDINDAARKRALLDVVRGRDSDLTDLIRAQRQDLGDQQVLAQQAAAEADASRADLADKLNQLNAAKAQQQAFEDKVQDRIEAALSESAALSATDAQLAKEIAAQQAALAARVGGGRGGAIVIGNIRVTTVGAITVATSIAPQVASLLQAAAAAGVPLGGSGYRDSSSQIALRQAHCGSSRYAIYEAPSSSCRPPTARPGLSQHERGLAVDFTYNGAIITSRSNPGYRWLAANAAKYGLRNLPSEPWHWSTTGD